MGDAAAISPRGTLKFYLGYAAGVGKTYAMLTEVRELKQQGADVVVGYFESHGRKDIHDKFCQEGKRRFPSHFFKKRILVEYFSLGRHALAPLGKVPAW